MPPAKPTGNSKKTTAKKPATKASSKSATPAKAEKPASKAKPAAKSSVTPKAKPKAKPVASKAKATATKAKPVASKAKAPASQPPAPKAKKVVEKSSLELALAADAAGKARDAIKQYKLHLGENPQDAGSHIALGHVYAAEEEFEFAVGCFEEAYALNSVTEVGYKLASLYQKAGYNSKALSLWTALLAKTEAFGEHHAVLTNLAQTYLKSGQAETALQMLERESLSAPLLESIACILTGNGPRALAQLQLALNEAPGEPLLYLLSGLVHYGHQQADKAIEHLELACPNKGKNPEITGILAHTYWLNGQHESALSAYEAIPAKARDGQTHLNMGLIYLEQHELDEAETCFEHARKSKSLVAEAAYWLAQCAMRQSHWADALKSYGVALKQSPANPEWLYEAGLVAYHAGVYHQAIDYWVNALELAPTRGDVFTALGHACYRVEAYDRAASAYQEAISRGVQEADLYLALGHAYLSQHAFDAAVEAYENAISHGANRPDVVTLLEQARQYAQIA